MRSLELLLFMWSYLISDKHGDSKTFSISGNVNSTLKAVMYLD